MQGVQLINDIKLQGTTIAADGTQTDVTGTVTLQAWQLPVLRQVAVALGPTAPALGPEPPPPANGIPVPVTQGKC